MEVGAYDLESEGPLPTLPSRKLEGPVVRAHTERASFSSEKPHNFWTVFELTTPNTVFECRKSLDIVFAIDISSSMQQKQKLTSVLAAISDVVSQLTERDRVSLIPYNEEAHVLFGLHHMTNANKNELQLLLQSIAARGNTNISDALFTALDVIEPKSDADRSRISALFLLTDGYSNRGLNHAEIIDTLSKRHTIENLTVFTFGYGNEHSAELLKDIAFSTGGGCYYYLNSPAEVMHCFSNCLSILKSTLYTNVRIRLEAFEGCRILKLHTKNPCCAFKPMKDFEVRCGSISAFEFRDLICRISIRNAAENKPHDLIRVILTYVNTFDGTLSISQEIVSVQRRPDSSALSPSSSASSSSSFLGANIYVEQQLNRQRAIDAIESSIEFVRGDNLNSAQITIYSVVHQIEQSVSYIKADPFTLYLLKTLLFCATSLLDLDCSSIYQAHNFISAHQQQRYIGLLPVFGDAQTDVFLQSLQQIRQRYNPSYSISILLPPPPPAVASSSSSSSSGSSGPSSSFTGSPADLYLPDKSSQLSVDC